MNKPVIIGAVLLLIGGGAVATTTIADKKIDALYEQDSIGMLKNIKVSDKDLGFTGGEVHWTADVVLDPCNTESMVTLTGTDTISKGLTGYTIHSEVSPVFENADMSAMLKGLPPLQVDTKVGWSGNGDMTFVLPAGKLGESRASVDWEDMQGNVDFDEQDDEMVFSDLNFSMPNTNVHFDSMQASLKDITYTSDIPLGYHLASGKSALSIGGINIDDTKQEIGFVSDKILIESTQEIHDDTVDVGMIYKFGPMEMNLEKQKAVIGESNLGMNVNGIDRPALQGLLDKIDKSSEECAAQTALTEDMDRLLLDIMAKGMTIESVNNMINIGKGSLTADATMVLPSQPYGSLQDAMETLPSKAEYDMEVSFDKALVQSLTELVATNSNGMSGNPEEDWQAIVDMVGAEVEGDKAVIRMSN